MLALKLITGSNRTAFGICVKLVAMFHKDIFIQINQFLLFHQGHDLMGQVNIVNTQGFQHQYTVKTNKPFYTI